MNDKPFKIYISCNKKDRDIAQKLRSLFHYVGQGRLEIKLRPDSIDLSNFEHYKYEIKNADLLLLLLTAQSRFSIDMFLTAFEVGFFASEKKQVYTLSEPELQIPVPLRCFRYIEAKHEEVKKFILELFGSTHITGRDEAIFPGITEHEYRNELADVIYRISQMLRPTPTPTEQMHSNSLILDFDKFQLKEFAENPDEKPKIPDDVTAKTETETLKMFGLLERQSLKWKDIYGSLKGEKTWVLELSAAIHSIIHGFIPNPMKSIFASSKNKSFIPVIYRDEKWSSGNWMFHVLFVPAKTIPVDPKLVFVITSFRDDMEPIYDAIKASANSFGLTAKRVKDVVGDYKITDKILELISKARYIVTDLTYERPNVYFELGYARGLEKIVITTVREGTTVHFDVKDWTYIDYKDPPILEQKLIERFGSEIGNEKE